jgi:hypothetical protein
VNQPPPPFKKSWIVKSSVNVKPLRVLVPMTKGDAAPPPFLRLEARRRGITGKLTKCPVLRPDVDAGNAEPDPWLTVSDSLKLAIGEKPIKVEEVSERAFRWYRLSRSAGTLFAAVATIIGAGLLTLGAIWPKTALGKGLLFGGGALTIVAAIVVVTSSWNASTTD